MRTPPIQRGEPIRAEWLEQLRADVVELGRRLDRLSGSGAGRASRAVDILEFAVAAASTTDPVAVGDLTYDFDDVETASAVTIEDVGSDRIWRPWLIDDTDLVVPAAVGSPVLGIRLRDAEAAGGVRTLFLVLEERLAGTDCGEEA